MLLAYLKFFHRLKKTFFFKSKDSPTLGSKPFLLHQIYKKPNLIWQAFSQNFQSIQLIIAGKIVRKKKQLIIFKLINVKGFKANFVGTAPNRTDKGWLEEEIVNISCLSYISLSFFNNLCGVAIILLYILYFFVIYLGLVSDSFYFCLWAI